jgi:hypothetical protein
LVNEEGYYEQLEDMLEFVEFAKTETEPGTWPVDLLNKYNPFGEFSEEDYTRILEKVGVENWHEATDLVEDDECIELFMLVSYWFKNIENLEMTDDFKKSGFIDGSGFGIYDLYSTIAKSVLQKCFDAKWFYYYKYRTKRPLERLRQLTGMICRNFFNYVHPGHPRYPAGHGGKFYAIIMTALLIWKIPRQILLELKVVCYVMAMARSGGGVHLPEDNLASGAFAGIEELSHYFEK